MAAKDTVGFVLRALQIIFAIVVVGTDGYAIHAFKSHTVYVHTDFGNFYETYGVPNSWGFLMFCAVWTFLVVIFLVIARNRFADHVLISYIAVVVEAIAFLSWTAGFIAVAVNIGTGVCPAESCGLLKAAVVFGAFEWLLFAITTTMTVMVVLKNTRWTKTSSNGSAIAMSSVV